MTDLFAHESTLVEPERYREWLSGWKKAYAVLSKNLNRLKAHNSISAMHLSTLTNDQLDRLRGWPVYANAAEHFGIAPGDADLFLDILQTERGINQRFQTRLSAYANRMMEHRHSVDDYRRQIRKTAAEDAQRDNMIGVGIRAVRINQQLEGNPRLRTLLESLLDGASRNPSFSTETLVESAREGLRLGSEAVDYFEALLEDKDLMENLVALRKDWQ